MLGDPDQVYGDAWLLVYQVETKESLLKAIQDKIDVRLSRHTSGAYLTYYMGNIKFPSALIIRPQSHASTLCPCLYRLRRQRCGLSRRRRPESRRKRYAPVED